MNEQNAIVDDQRVTASHWPGSPSKSTIVLLHGFPMDRHLWDSVGDRLGTSHPVLAIDLPGFGGSGTENTVLGMPETADWLAAALDAFQVNAPVVLVGLSMGGYIAMEFAVRHPDRLKQLVFCSTKAEADSDAARKGRIEMAEAVEHIGVSEIAEAMLPKLLADSTRKLHPHVAEQLREMIERVAPSTIAAAQRGMAVRHSMLDKIPQWPFRIDCIAGENDTLAGPDVMQSMVGAARNAEMHVIPKIGHVAPLEAPEALSQCILRHL